MFNNLVNDKKYEIPKEEEIPNWVLAGEFLAQAFHSTKPRYGLNPSDDNEWTIFLEVE